MITRIYSDCLNRSNPWRSLNSFKSFKSLTSFQPFNWQLNCAGRAVGQEGRKEGSWAGNLSGYRRREQRRRCAGKQAIRTSCRLKNSQRCQGRWETHEAPLFNRACNPTAVDAPLARWITLRRMLTVASGCGGELGLSDTCSTNHRPKPQEEGLTAMESINRRVKHQESRQYRQVVLGTQFVSVPAPIQRHDTRQARAT
jgi:hypothetical protein